MVAKKESKLIERVYNVPLRKEFRKVPRWRKTKKAVKAMREFLAKHMKSENVKLSPELNELLWKHGIKNPPHHVKVTVTKDEEGLVKADLFGTKMDKAPKKEVKKEEKKTEDKKEADSKEDKVEVKEESKEVKAEKAK